MRLNFYPVGDLHPESEQFNERLWYTWKKTVMEDEFGYWGYIGDMFDNALKKSKTNSYEQRMRPRDAKIWLTKELGDIRDKCFGGCDGNHEYRSVYECDDSPLYDVMSKLDLEDYHRPNACFMKIAVGEKSKDRQFAYTFVLQHGKSRGKVVNYSYAIDGMDVMITGHTHGAESGFPAKIVIDPYNEMVRQVPFKRVIVPSMLDFGGYAMRDMYMPQDNTIIPVVTLLGDKKKVEVSWK